MELNGLRAKSENDGVLDLTGVYNLPAISGGDRHAHEPNACVNLTNAASFAEFVTEIRIDRHSNVLFLPQYEWSLRYRFARNVCDVMRDHPEHQLGWVRLTDRVFYRGEDGEERALSQLWPTKMPTLVQSFSALVRAVDSVAKRVGPALPNLAHVKPDCAQLGGTAGDTVN